jgi:hypothetical protein
MWPAYGITFTWIFAFGKSVIKFLQDSGDSSSVQIIYALPLN